MISPRVTTSRFSLAISRPMTLLPGITSTTRTLSTESARARSLARLVIWLAFTPGAGRSSKRVTTGPGLHRDDLRLDVEVLELHLHQARQRLERLGGIQRLARRRIIEQLQRRQLPRLGRIEERHLPLFLDALALLDARGRRLDLGRRPRRGASSARSPRHPCAPARRSLSRRDVLRARAPLPHPAYRGPGPAAQPIHDGEPGHLEREREARHPRGEKQQSRAKKSEAILESITDFDADDAAGGLTQHALVPVQGRETAACGEQQQEAARRAPPS